MADDYGDPYWSGGTDWSSYDFSGGSSMPNATLITSYDKPGEDYGSSAYVPSSADKAALYGNEGYGEGMTGAQTSAYDTTLNTTGSTSLANALSKLFGSGTGSSGILGGIGSLLSSKAGIGVLAAILSAMDRQKATGGGTAQAYAGPGKIPTRTITQGKYGPIAQYAAQGGLMQAYASGGKVQMEDGGFVMTKKAVDGAGGPQGLQQLIPSARHIRGPGTGTSDDIPASINGPHGETPARVSNGEAYIPRRAVQAQGGPQKLYALMRNLQKRA